VNRTENDALLAVHGLNFDYGSKNVMRNFNLQTTPGVTWLCGANGSGKSTLLKLLAGALEPQSGTRSVSGFDPVLAPLHYRREVFWCGPDALAFEHLTGAEYLAFMASLYPRFHSEVLSKHIHGLGLTSQLGVQLSQLSTGTGRKIWLAAALTVGTAVILLDEPLNALDESSKAYLRNQISDQATKTTQCWIIASHEAPCDNSAIMQRLELSTHTT
jgi:ATPase subunit of ABC transporter with duplicated ATPase domains